MLSERLTKIRALCIFALVVIFSPAVLTFSFIYLIWKSINKTRKSIAGEVALVTGSATGLGKEIAIQLASKGCHIAIADINKEAAELTAKLIRETYNVKSQAFKVDVTQFAEVELLSQKVEEQLGAVTILVNNAGIMTFSSSTNPSPSEIQNMINTNLTSHIWTSRVFMDKMRQHGKGHIVAMSSLAGVIPCHRQMEYTATKFGVRGLMGALRTEIYALNCDFIKTTTVFPFFLKTNLRVDDLITKFGMNSMYPSISGGEAADAVVEGILTNEMEVFLPGFSALAYRLLEILPIDWQAAIINNFFGRTLMAKIEY